MYHRNVIFLLLAAAFCDASSKGNLHATSASAETISRTDDGEGKNTCDNEDIQCLMMSDTDRQGLEAIRSLHQQLDDDADGNIDLSETGDFLRQDLKLDSGYEKRQKAFHKNDDMDISVRELWEAWTRSEVHNWTIEQTVEWLTTCVDLPQYVNTFIQHKVTGAALPRLAVNNMQYLTMLGIKDPIHKQKISLKAMDVVLFGPPKDGHHQWKDLVLIILVIGGGVGVWYGFQQKKNFKNHVNRMCKDMEGLQNAEFALEKLQHELDEARKAQQNVVSEKQNLEKRLQETAAAADSSTLHASHSEVEVSQLKAEIEMLRTELQIAEGELKDRCWSPPHGLQQWLQLTHEIENKAYIKKKLLAEKQLQSAREACEKLRKKRSSIVGAFVSTHGKSIDDVDRTIVEARTSLNEVTHELQERVFRWKQIEMLCGFNIVNNSGLQSLENSLYRNANGRAIGLKGRMSSQDDLDDDTSSIYGHSAGIVDSGLQQHSWREPDSSGSDISNQEEETVRQSINSVNFIVGDEVEEPPAMYQRHSRVSSQPPPSIKSLSNSSIPVMKTSVMIRSYSQDTNLVPQQEPSTSCVNQKSSYSDTSLDHFDIKKKKIQRSRQCTIKEQVSLSNEDVCSTDSSVVEEDIKRRKRKFFNFGRSKIE